MKSSLKKKWVEALRSGKYKQGRGALWKGDNTLCCLGILCKISKHIEWDTTKPYKQGEPHEAVYIFGDTIAGAPEPSNVYLPESFAERCGLTRTGGFVDARGFKYNLSVLNDKGKSFKFIASLIEKELPAMDR